MSKRRASEITKVKGDKTPTDRKRKAQDLSTEEKTPKKSRTSLAETPRSRIYRSRSVKDTAKTPEKDRGAKSAPKTPKSGDKRKRSDTGENVFQAAHFDSESEASMVESDDEEELRRKKKIRKVEKEQDTAINPDKYEPVKPASAKKPGTKLFIDPSLFAPKDTTETKAASNPSTTSPFKNIVPEAKSPEDIRRALSEVKAKRKSLGKSESDPTPKTPTARETFKFIPEAHSSHSDPMLVEEDKEENSTASNTQSGFHYEPTSPFTFIPTPAVVLKRSGDDATINRNNHTRVEYDEAIKSNNTNRHPADHVDFFNNYTTPDLPPKSPKNPFRELAELEARAGPHTPIFGTEQDELSGSDRSAFTTQAPNTTAHNNPFLPRAQQSVSVVKPINQSQPAKVLWNRDNVAESRVVESVPFGQKQQQQVPAKPTIQHRRISIMPSPDHVASTDFGIEQVDPTEENPTAKIHLPKKQPRTFKALKTIIGFLLLGLAVGALAYYIVNFVEVKQNEAVLSRMEKILKAQHGLADCGEAYSPILSGSDILKKYNENYGPIDDTKADSYLGQLAEFTEIQLYQASSDIPEDAPLSPRLYRFEHEHSLKPWECVMREFVAEYRTPISAIGLAILGILGVLLTVKRRRVANMHVQGLVSRIQAELISKKNNSNPYIAKEHLRERLVNAKLNKDSAGHWNKAEKIIEDDSRVLVTPQLIHGQQMDCWRWVAS
jgi:hypothetical protein